MEKAKKYQKYLKALKKINLEQKKDKRKFNIKKDKKG